MRGRKECPKCGRKAVISLLICKTVQKAADPKVNMPSAVKRRPRKIRRYIPMGFWCESCGWHKFNYPTFEERSKARLEQLKKS
jgi:transcription elongation factor Elf1